MIHAGVNKTRHSMSSKTSNRNLSLWPTRGKAEIGNINQARWMGPLPIISIVSKSKSIILKINQDLK